MKTYAYTDAARTSILVTDSGEATSVPTDPGNRHFREILDGIADGSITVAAYTAPPIPPSEPDYDAELIANIEAATTIAGLKAALVGGLTGAKSRVRGAPK